MGIAAGEKIGPYEVISPLGAGGMGEVYRARDGRLGRQVAIKVVSRTLAKDPDRLRRFALEARTVAALNHPNILGIHDIGTHDGSPYLVSELLEGETLREKLVNGALPVRRAVEYALGIALGLAAAHDKGIIHRDLKPENVFITRDGRVKVLDFGLAKLVRPDPGQEMTLVSDRPDTAFTQPGVVVGTVGYMSPEQVRGEVSDGRSDIFSFGSVLYEMLTGKRAFKKDTTAETMTAILKEEPPELTETGWQGPLGLQKILSRCLEKNVERRFQSASDLAFAIESLSGTAVSQKLAQEKLQVKRAWWPWALAAAGMVLLAAGAWFAGKRSSVRRQPKFNRLTYQQGQVTEARFAKDGTTIVYGAQWENEPLKIYTVRTEFPQSTKLDLPTASLLAVSPSGDMEVSVDPKYHSNFFEGTLAQAQISGGTPREQMKNVISADYGPDGKTLALTRSVNERVQLEYPAGKALYTISGGYLDHVRVSADGKRVAFLEHPVFDDDRGWVAVIDEAANRKVLTPEYATVRGLAWSRTGEELWYTGASSSTNRSLWGVTGSGKVREILSAPLILRVQDIAPDGRVLLVGEHLQSQISGIDPETRKERKGLEWFNGTSLSDLSKDGKSILFFEWGGSAGQLYLVGYRKLDGSAPVALGDGALPVFSPDETVAAATLFTRPPKVALYPIGPGESRQLGLGELTSVYAITGYPDAKHLVLIASAPGEALRTYEMDLEGGKPQAVGPVGFQGSAVTSDRNRIAGRDAAGEAVVFDKETQKMQPIPEISPEESILKWSDDGQAVLVARSTPWHAEVSRVEVSTGKRTVLEKMELSDRAGSSFNLRMNYSERSKTYVYNDRRIFSNLYVVEGLE